MAGQCCEISAARKSVLRCGSSAKTSVLYQYGAARQIVPESEKSVEAKYARSLNAVE